MSNYEDLDWDDEVDVAAPADEYEVEMLEVRCPARCRNGQVEVHGQETDCITCEGYGTIMIPA